jgi:hypothetical protein
LQARTTQRREQLEYRVTNLPEELTIIQRGRDPTHFEIVPAYPMAQAE